VDLEHRAHPGDALRAAWPRLREHRGGRGLALVGELLEVYLSAQYAVVTVDYASAGPRHAERRGAPRGPRHQRRDRLVRV